jgi:hypothetical protein
MNSRMAVITFMDDSGSGRPDNTLPGSPAYPSQGLPPGHGGQHVARWWWTSLAPADCAWWALYREVAGVHGADSRARQYPAAHTGTEVEAYVYASAVHTYSGSARTLLWCRALRAH